MDNDNHEVLSASLTTLSIKEEPTPSNSKNINTSNTKVEDDCNIKSLKSSNKPVIRQLPAHNVPEKIVICIDTCLDPNYTCFKTCESMYTPLSMLKRVIELFVHNKHCMDSRHEFALLALDKNNIKWLKEFTNLPRQIIGSLRECDYVECEQDEEYDLSVLLDEVWQMVSVPKVEKEVKNSPPYVVRLILLYSRSYSVPILKKSFKELLENPYFIIDTISISDESLEKSKHKEIVNNLQIDEKGLSYNFWVGRETNKLYESMAKLLGHPLQRPIQSEVTSYAAPVFEKEE